MIPRSAWFSERQASRTKRVTGFQYKAAFLCLITAGMAWPQGPGAEDLKQLSLEELSQIEVTSVTKEAVPAFRTPAAISVLTSEQIQQSGARTIPDLLRLVPGVNVAQADSNSWAVGIRGFQGLLSRSVLVLIDGRSVYTPLFAGVYWDMQDVMTEDIERIEVIRGPGGTIWGSNAVNGVINIITKSAHDTQGSLISMGGGNVDQGELAARYGGTIGVWNYRVYAKGFSRGPEEHADRQNFDDWRRGQFGFRADAQLGPRDQLTVQGDVYGGVAGQSVQLSYFTPPSIVTALGNRTFSGENVMAAWRHTLRSGSDIQVRTYYDRTDRQELNYREIRNTFDADFLHHIPLGRNDVTWGFGVRVSPSHFFELVPTVDFLPFQQTYNIFSAFLQDDISLVKDRLSLTVGSKFEHTTFNGFNFQPSARLAWTPNANWTVWTAVTRAVRTASRIEHDFNFSLLSQPSIPLYYRLIGDPDFSPEQLVSYEAGARRYVNKRGFLSLALFHNRYTDLLSVELGSAFVENAPQAPRVILPLTFGNGIAANTTGGELSGVWDLKHWWRVRGSYSLVLVDAKRQPGSNDTSTVSQLQGDTAAHNIVLQSNFQLPKHLNLNFAFRHVSSIPDQHVPGYSTADTRLGWQSSTPLGFEVVGQNLFQAAHIEYGGIPGPLIAIKRSVYAGLVWRH